jgi:hypothetical protein
VGYYSGYNITTGNKNTFIGSYAGGTGNSSGNVLIGDYAGYSLASENNNNVMIGSSSGYKNTGSGNVFIGINSGFNETGSNKLYIDISSTANPLVWGDFSTRNLSFNGDVGFKIIPTHLIHLSGGAYSDGTNWTNASDRNLKENFESVNGEELIGLINELTVTKWNYKTDDPRIKHIGPVAQDFYSLFGLGNDDKSISSIDPSGVALAAIKELSRQNKSMKKQVESQQKEIDELKALVNTLVANQSGQGNK